MKKRKDKKLKKQFKKLLQQQLASHLQDSDIKFPEKEKVREVTDDKGSNQELSDKKNVFVKRDLKRTVLITLFVISVLILVHFYLNSSGQASNFSKMLLRLIGAS